MNTQDFLNLSPDEINVIVAEHLAGVNLKREWQNVSKTIGITQNIKTAYAPTIAPPNYYNSMDLCMEVLEKIHEDIGKGIIHISTGDGDSVDVDIIPRYPPDFPNGKGLVSAHVSLPLPFNKSQVCSAIIVACLKAKGYLED